MSYQKMIKWNRGHRKGTTQPIIMHTDSGFWPSASFSKKWLKYATELEEQGRPYLGIEEYYKSQLR